MALAPLTAALLVHCSATFLPVDAGRLYDAVPTTLDVPPGRFYVGQVVEARVVVVAGSERPSLVIGATPSFDVTTLASVEVVPLATGAPGSVGQRTNAYRLPLRVVPRRAGRHELPTIRVEARGRSALVPPKTLAVAALPRAGRTDRFLGGVGRIDPTAELSEGVVRSGAWFEYRVRLDGPGSVASTADTEVDGDHGLVFERLADEVRTEPASRTLRFRARAGRAGSVAIPPFRVSWFDPDSGRYQTTASRGLTLRIVEVPTFDDSRVEGPEIAADRGPEWAVASVVGATGAAVAAACLALARFRVRRQETLDPRLLAEELARPFEAETGRTLCADILNALVRYFEEVGGRPSSAMTPRESRSWAERLGAGEALASRVEELAALCDRGLYRGDPPEEYGEVAEEAASVFRSLGEAAFSRPPDARGDGGDP